MFFHDSRGHKPSETLNRKDEADADYKETKAQLSKLELEIKRGEWRRADEIDKQNVAKVLAVKRALLGLGRNKAPHWIKFRDARKLQKAIDEEMKSVIRAFAGQ